MDGLREPSTRSSPAWNGQKSSSPESSGTSRQRTTMNPRSTSAA
jgi:hypothetical protein